MEILSAANDNLKGISVILGFFDGIHKGHREVISSALNTGRKTALITFKESPAVYFGKDPEYIYPRSYSYKLIGALGVDYLIEADFQEIVNIKAEDYLRELAEIYEPVSISTGFNYTFGYNREGTPEMLKDGQNKYGYEYYMSAPCTENGVTVSSTCIKTFLKKGEILSASSMLGEPYTITGKVIYGEQTGRKIGFPTANIKYPANIVKIPYGVYKAKVSGMPAIMNFGVKPTLNGSSEGIEVHIPGFDGDLYGKEISISVFEKIRDERKFESIDELKLQIGKDTEECLK